LDNLVFLQALQVADTVCHSTRVSVQTIFHCNWNDCVAFVCRGKRNSTTA